MYDTVPFLSHFKKGLLFFIKLLIIPILLYAAYLGYLAWRGGDVASNIPSTFGLNEELPIDTSLAGALYFSAVSATNEFDYPQIFKYLFSEQSSAAHMLLPSYSYGEENQGFETMIAYQEDTEDPDNFEPSWYQSSSDLYGPLLGVKGFNEVDLVTSPDGIHYAYAYQSEAGLETLDIKNWKIALHNFETGENILIEEATEPAFINDGADLLYMKNDGIYRYNLEAKVSDPFYQLYVNLSNIDDYAVSPDEVYLVLTAPSVNIISVAQMIDAKNGEVREIGLINTPGVRYRFPVISPDSRFYAVMAAYDDKYNESEDVYLEIKAEIRAMNSEKIIDKVSFDSPKLDGVQLDRWVQ